MITGIIVLTTGWHGTELFSSPYWNVQACISLQVSG